MQVCRHAYMLVRWQAVTPVCRCMGACPILYSCATAFAYPDNERQVQRAFENLSKDKTVIMIAHRLSTIINADRIVVLHNGEIAEIGTHKELMALGGIYKHLYELDEQD